MKNCITTSSTTCPSCHEAIDITIHSACPHCGWRLQTGQSVIKPAGRPKIPVELELAITDDRTGSSQQFSIGIPKTLEMILKMVVAKVRSVKCWLQSHGDKDCGQEEILLTDGGTAEQAMEDIKKVAYDGGGDAPEHHLDAIEHLLSIVPWSTLPQSRGAMLGFMTADSKPTHSGLSATQLGEEIKKRNIQLYLVCEPTPTLNELIVAAEGIMFPISNTPEPQELQRIAAQLSKSIVDISVRGKTTPLS